MENKEMRAFTSFVRSTTAVVQILWCCPKWRRTPKKGADGSGSLAHWLSGSTPFKWQTSCSVTWMLPIEQLQSLPGHGIGWEIVATVSKTFGGIIISWSGFPISNPDESWLNLKILLCCKFVASFTLVAGKVRKGRSDVHRFASSDVLGAA